jgi:hypothetical protein
MASSVPSSVALRREPGSPRPRATHPRRALLVASTVAALALTPVADAATPVALDTTDPLAIAASGGTVAWLRPTNQAGSRAELVVRDGPGATPRVVGQPLPAGARDLALGTDARGTVTAIVATANARRTAGVLYRVALDGSRAPSRLPAAGAGTISAAPGLRDVVLSFSRYERLAEGRHWTVRVGSLAGRRTTLVHRGAAGLQIDATVPVVGKRIAFVTDRVNPRDAGHATELRVIRPGSRSVLLSRTSSGGASDAGFGPLTVTPDGRRLTVSRFAYGGGHPTDTTTFALPSDQQLERHPTRHNDIELPLGGEGYVSTTEAEPNGVYLHLAGG